MILVDTSVWVDALRRRGSVSSELERLLDQDSVLLAAPVRIEILSGAANRDRNRLRLLLSALPVAYPADSTWQRLDEWVELAGSAGERFGFADLLIAGLAADRDAAVWSLDADFERMAALGFIRPHAPSSETS